MKIRWKILFNVYFVLFFLLSGCIIRNRVKLDAQSEGFYKRVRLLMTKQEEEVFLNLPDVESRKKFIKEFWDIRDPNPYTEENEYKDEIERRFEFASRRFKEAGRPGWDSDRGRIFILLGPPDNVREYPMLSGYYKGVIVWLYGNYQLAVRFVDKIGDGTYELNTYSSDLLDAMETAKYTLMGGNSVKYKIRPLRFKFNYSNNVVKLDINIKDLLLKKYKDKYKTEIEVVFLLYYKDKTFDKIKRIKKMSISKDELLNKKTIGFSIPLSINKKGKIYIDTIITDLLGNKRGRKIFKIK